jgi:hypothetical protein
MDPQARVMAIRKLTTGICVVVFEATTMQPLPLLGSSDRAAPTQSCAGDEHYWLMDSPVGSNRRMLAWWRHSRGDMPYAFLNMRVKLEGSVNPQPRAIDAIGVA